MADATARLCLVSIPCTQRAIDSLESRVVNALGGTIIEEVNVDEDGERTATITFDDDIDNTIILMK